MAINWRIIHKDVTESTNIDAKAGVPWDVYTALFQTKGRGRLDHKWVSAQGENVIMSAVLDVADIDIVQVSTIPLMVGLAVVEAIIKLVSSKFDVKLKWPNEVSVNGRKIAGILCERNLDSVIAGIGINVRQTSFPKDVEDRAISFSLLGVELEVAKVCEVVLSELALLYEQWACGGFKALYSRVMEIDWLKGRHVLIFQTDEDTEPVDGICSGILPDGTLGVGGVSIWAGEAHVKSV